RIVHAVATPQGLNLAVCQLDGFWHQVALQQDLDGQQRCAGASRGCCQLSPRVGHTYAAKSLGHSRQEKPSEDWRIGSTLGAAIQQDVGQWQSFWRRGSQCSHYALIEDGQESDALQDLLFVAGQARVQVLGHAFELLRQFGDVLLAQCQAAADGRGEEGGDAWSSAEQTGEPVAWQSPEHTRAERCQRCGASLVAEEPQVAEDGWRFEDIQAHAVGLTFDAAFTQDVQRIGASALGKDHLFGVVRNLLQRRGQSSPVNWRQLRKRSYQRQIRSR